MPVLAARVWGVVLTTALTSALMASTLSSCASTDAAPKKTRSLTKTAPPSPTSKLSAADAIAALRAVYPGAAVDRRVPCVVGGTSVYGLVFHRPEDVGGERVLRGAVVMHSDSSPRVVELAQGYSGETFGIHDFLSEFWSEGALSPSYVISCGVPGSDEQGPTESGTLMGAYSDKTLADVGAQLCFQADAVYNNWLCFMPDDKAGVVLSYAEMHAD